MTTAPTRIRSRLTSLSTGAYVPKNQHQQQQHNLAAAAMAANFTGALSSPLMGMGPMNGMGLMDPNMGNRTVYLGNLHPDVSAHLSRLCSTRSKASVSADYD